MRFIAIGLIAILITFVGNSCKKKSDLQILIDEELSSEIKYDSLFLGLYFGMDKLVFFDYCKELNQKNILVAGPSQYSVGYNINDKLNFPCLVSFYPKFEENKIVELPLVFKYKGWSPYIKKVQSEALLEDVLVLYQEWFGKYNLIIESKDVGSKNYVWVNGNRKISIYSGINGEVHVDFNNLIEK